MVTLHQYLTGARQTKKHKKKSPALKGCCQKKGTVLRLDILKPKKPNSAKRKVAKVRLRNGKEIMTYIPGIGHNVQKHSDVMVRGGRVPDLPGVRYHLYRHKCDFSASENFQRHAGRSKYGIKLLKEIKDINTDT